MMLSAREVTREARKTGLRTKKNIEWQDTAIDLIRSLMENMITTRSIDVKKRCMQSIENEVSKLAYDSAILHRERMRYDDTAECSLQEMHRMDKDNRGLRLQADEANERAAMAERRLREVMSKLAETERSYQRLSLDEGCRERLVQALRQLEEESQAKTVAEQQVRGQMERIHALSADREELARELERERADKAAAQSAVSDANGKSYELMKSVGAAEQARQTLQTQVEEVKQQLEAARARADAAQHAAVEAEQLKAKDRQATALMQRLEEDLHRDRELLRSAEEAKTKLEASLKEVSTQLRTCQDKLDRDVHVSQRDAAEAKHRVQSLSEELAEARRELSETQQLLRAKGDKAAELSATNAEQAATIEQMLHRQRELDARADGLQRKLLDTEGVLEHKEGELGSTLRRLEDENRRLEEQNRMAAVQFNKLGEESTRLLSACEVERDLRSKLETALQIKERQVSSLMEMNARLSADLYAHSSAAAAAAASSSRGPQHAFSPPNAARAPAPMMHEHERYTSAAPAPLEEALFGAGGAPWSHAKTAAAAASHPPGMQGRASPGLGGRPAAASPFTSRATPSSAPKEHHLGGSKGAGIDRQKLMDEIEGLMSSLQTRPN